MVDCTNVNNLISTQVGGRQGFILLALLTKLHFECLKQIQDDRRSKFPKDQEDILFGKIESEVKGLRSNLLQLDAEHLKLIELALVDYKSSGDITLNKRHLVEFLASSYKAISETISKIQTPVEPPDPLDERGLKRAELLREWKETIEQFSKDKKIEVSSDKATLDKVKDYLNVRRNADSLHTIYSTIHSGRECLDTTGFGIEEKRLVLQKVLQKVGECIKGTANTPNLSDDISKSLEEKGIPVKFLADFRDRIAHYQIFPLKLNGPDIRQLFNDGLDPMKQIIRDEVIEIEKGFVQRLVQENAPKIKEENIKKSLQSYANEDAVKLLNYVNELRKEATYHSLSVESKRVVDEIYGRTVQMKSKELLGADFPTQKLDTGKLDIIKKYTEKNELKVIKNIQDKLRSWQLGLDKGLDEVASIEKVVDYFQNGIPSRSKEKAEAHGVLNNFLGSTDVLNTITLNDRGTRLSLKDKLKQYFDLQSFKDGAPYSEFGGITKNSLALVLESSSGNSDSKKTLLNFFERNGNSIAPGQYEELVKGLKLGPKSEEKLLLYSVEGRKKKCIDLLKSNPPALKVICDSIMEGKVIPFEVYRNLAKQYKPKGEAEADTKNRAISLQKGIESKVGDLYSGEVKEKIDSLNKLLKIDNVQVKADAVQMQFLSVYSLLYSIKNKNGDDPFLIRKFRNHLAHEEQSEAFKKEFLQLVETAVETIDTSKVVTLSDFNDAFSKALVKLNLSEIKKVVSSKTGAGQISSSFSRSLNLCATNSKSRTRRSIAECLFSKEDVEQFIKGNLDVNDADKVVIDSKKFLTYVKSSQDEAKNAQLVKFIEGKSVEGDYGYLVDRVVQERGYERYIRNERIKDLYGEILQTDVASTKTSKLKGRLMNAAGRIQLIRGIHGTAVSCKEGTATDCGFAVSGLAWSFASEPIEHVIVKAAPKAVQSAGHLVGKMIPGTLGRQAQFVAVRLVGAKVVSKVAKGVAGAVGGVFDIIDVGRSAKSLIECKVRKNSDNPCTEKEIRDEIVSISFSGVSFVSGIALAAASMPGVGIAVGFALMVGEGVYNGISNIVEYRKKYDTTNNENLNIFLNTILLLPPPYDVQRLATRTDIVDSRAKRAWENLGTSSVDVVAYGIGLGWDSGANSFSPGYGKILMNRTDADTTNFSRVLPKLSHDDAEMICLPQITEKVYEKGLKQSVPTAVHYCENAMVVVDKRRKHNGTIILYDLESLIGTVVGSNRLNNDFLIFDKGAAIIGGSNTTNRFVLLKPASSFTSISCGNNATNIIDLSQLKRSHYPEKVEIVYSCAPNDFTLFLDGRSLVYGNVERKFDISRYYYVGSRNMTDKISCLNTQFGHVAEDINCGAFIDSGGGLSKSEKDIVDNCKKVSVMPYTRVTGGRGDYTFYVQTAGYRAEDLYSEIDIGGKGTVIFPETSLLNDCNEITYSANNNNTLSLKIGLENHNQYTLDIRNYISQSSGQPNFVLIDRSGSNIVPKPVELSSLTTKIDSFEVHLEHSLDNFDVAENQYKKILGDNKGYKIFGFVRGKRHSQGNSTFQCMVFGSSASDIINFDQGNMFARGGNGSDMYVIDNTTEKREVIIDNNSDDRMLDTLMIPEVSEEFSVQKCNLHLNYNNAQIQVRNYLKESSYRHLMVMNSKGETFIPYTQLISCVGSSKESGKLVPFFHATQTQYIFLLPKDFQGNHVVIHSLPEEIERYKEEDDLLLVRAAQIPFIIKIEGFYNDQSKWQDVNFLLWNNGNFSQYSGWYQEVDGVMDYQEKIMNDYKKSVEEYFIDFTQSVNITHNQDDTLGEDEKRIGVVILKNITPDRIQVSSSNQDLAFSDKISKHVVNVKNWSVSQSYRVSTLEFDLGLEPIIIRRLDEFSLSNIVEIQALINEASKAFQGRFECKTEIEARNSEGRTPLYCAAAKGQFDVVEYLIGKRPDYIYMRDEHGRSPLHVAALYGHVSVVEKLIEKGADVDCLDNDLRTPLHLAADQGHSGVVEKLIKGKADVNAADTKSCTPLYFAARKGHLNVVGKLIESKARVDARNDGGYVPLYTATQHGHLNVVEKLVDSNADVNAQDYGGHVPLHIAAQEGHLNIVEKLIESKADVNAVSNRLWTALHFAARYGHLNVVKYLLSKGANISSEVNSGQTSLSLATDGKHNDVVEYLEKKLNETIGGPKQRRRRHHHGDHSLHHLSHKPLSADLDGQPEIQIAMSGGTRPSSWINGLFNWVNEGTERAKNLVGGWLIADTAGFKVGGKENILKSAVSEVDKDGTILLLDTLIRRATGKKYISNNIMSISEDEAHIYALNITEGFEKTVKQAGENSKIATGRLDVDFVEVEGKITEKIVSGKLDEISAVLHTYAHKACPDRKVGSPCRLSQKKFDKFMKEVDRKQDILLNESILRMVDGAESNKCLM